MAHHQGQKQDQCVVKHPRGSQPLRPGEVEETFHSYSLHLHGRLGVFAVSERNTENKFKQSNSGCKDSGDCKHKKETKALNIILGTDCLIILNLFFL